MIKQVFAKVSVLVFSVILPSQALAIESPNPKTINVQSSSKLNNLIAQITIDPSGLPESYANGIIDMLGYLGIQPTGTVKENNEVWCVFNDWKARDQVAKNRGTYDRGRFSIDTTFGGKWYCTAK